MCTILQEREEGLLELPCQAQANDRVVPGKADNL